MNSGLTDKEIRAAIDILKSDKPSDLAELASDDFIAWINPRGYFCIKNEELCAEAVKLNERNGKDIFDRRTRGWKSIKEKYEGFIN